MKQLTQRLNESLGRPNAASPGAPKQAELPKQAQANISKLQAQQQEQAQIISSLKDSMAQFQSTQSTQSTIAQKFREQTNTRLDSMDTRMTDMNSGWQAHSKAMMEEMRSFFQQANSNGPSQRQAPDPPHPPADNEEKDTDDDDDDDDQSMDDNPPPQTRRSHRGSKRF